MSGESGVPLRAGISESFPGLYMRKVPISPGENICLKPYHSMASVTFWLADVRGAVTVLSGCIQADWTFMCPRSQTSV